LIEISKEAYLEGHKYQKAVLGIFRVDYMIEAETNDLKLIELNTIASAGGALCD